jgi:hypothetical protein
LDSGLAGGHFNGSIHRALLGTDSAKASLKGEAGGNIDSGHAHLHCQVEPEHSRLARRNAGEIMAHPTGLLDRIDHRRLCRKSKPRRRVNDRIMRASLDAGFTARAASQKRLLFDCAGRS